MSARNSREGKARRRAERTAVLLTIPEDGEFTTPALAQDRAVERSWILDPDGHRELQGRGAGLPAGVQAHGWACSWCAQRIPTIPASGAGLGGVLPIPVLGNATLCPACARTVVPDPGRDWDGSCCSCAACQARRAKLGL